MKLQAKNRADRTTALLAHLDAKGGDHRLWKKLFRNIAESLRDVQRKHPNAAPAKNDPAITTAVDAVARRAARGYAKRGY